MQESIVVLCIRLVDRPHALSPRGGKCTMSAGTLWADSHSYICQLHTSYDFWGLFYNHIATCMCTSYYVQWNLSIVDTLVTAESVLIIERCLYLRGRFVYVAGTINHESFDKVYFRVGPSSTGSAQFSTLYFSACNIESLGMRVATCSAKKDWMYVHYWYCSFFVFQ